MSIPTDPVNRVRSRLAGSANTVAPSEPASAARNLSHVGPAASSPLSHRAPDRLTRSATVHTRLQLRVTR